MALRTLVSAGLFLTIVLNAGSACPQEAAAQIQWLRSYPEAVTRAAAEKKLILVYLYAGWCPWCKRMDRETWIDPSVVSLSRNFVPLKLDGENDADGARLRQKMVVRGFPSVLLLHADGSEYERLDGFLQAPTLLQRITALSDDPDSLANLRAAAAKNPKDMTARYKLGRNLLSRGDFAGAQKNLEELIRLDPKSSADLTDSALFYLSMSQALQADLPAALATLSRLERDFPKSDLLPQTLLMSGELMLQAGRRDEGRKRIEEFIRNYPEHSLAERARRLLAEK